MDAITREQLKDGETIRFNCNGENEARCYDPRSFIQTYDVMRNVKEWYYRIAPALLHAPSSAEMEHIRQMADRLYEDNPEPELMQVDVSAEEPPLTREEYFRPQPDHPSLRQLYATIEHTDEENVLIKNEADKIDLIFEIDESVNEISAEQLGFYGLSSPETSRRRSREWRMRIPD